MRKYSKTIDSIVDSIFARFPATDPDGLSFIRRVAPCNSYWHNYSSYYYHLIPRLKHARDKNSTRTKRKRRSGRGVVYSFLPLEPANTIWTCCNRAFYSIMNWTILLAAAIILAASLVHAVGQSACYTPFRSPCGPASLCSDIPSTGVGGGGGYSCKSTATSCPGG